MAHAPTLYRRLPGRGSTAVASFRLYLAADHLLQVASIGFKETYKRFFFLDIQAICLCKTVMGKIWNIVWGGLAAFFALIGLSVGGVGAVGFWIAACVWTLLLPLN